MKEVGDTSILSELYLYWDTKRAGREMPARTDVDPIDIPLLLPYITLVERETDGAFRYRLMGTAVSRQLGRDLTGQRVGFHVRPAAYGKKMAEIYEAVFSSHRPLFTSGEYKSAYGTIHVTCRLTAPLSRNGDVAMAIAARIARSAPSIATSADWTLDAVGEVLSVTPVATIDELERLCQEWTQRYAADGS